MPRPAFQRLVVALLAVMVSALISGSARAQTGATFAYQTTEAGWNLLGFLPVNGLDLSGPVYTWQAGDASYETPTTGTLGQGYWAYFGDADTYPLSIAGIPSVDVTIPAGQCVMVGNPSHQGSARVIGASRTYVYSTVLNTYVQENLIPIGRGAWSCNDQATTQKVTIVDQGDVINPDWPSCCAPKSVSNGGLARITIHNDSPYPLIATGRQIDASGGLAQGNSTGTILFTDVIRACTTCPEYGSGGHTQCSPDATSQVVNLQPGNYTMHLQSEGALIPDLLAPVIVLQANTSYDACWFVDQNRPQKNY